MKGKKCLFPFGFHCTGMPIKAASDKLAREMELFGTPPVFPVEETDAESAVKQVGPKYALRLLLLTALVLQKSKVAAKTGGAKWQWQIMKMSDIPESEIPKFADALHWLEYFPPIAVKDLTKLGLKVNHSADSWRSQQT